MLYSRPMRPMATDVVSFYDRYHGQNDQTSKVISRNNLTYWFIIRLLETALPSPKGQTILDLGCGVGTLAFYLAHQGAIVLGADVSARAIALAKHTQVMAKVRGVKFIQVDLAGAALDSKLHPMIPGGFDAILCSEVLEHIADDVGFLKQCRARLRVGGKLILTTQRRDSWLVQRGLLRHHDAAVGHVRRYEPAALLALLQKVGFSPELVTDADGPLRTLFYTTKLGFLLKFVKGPLIPWFQWLDQRCVPLVGAIDIQIVARRV